MSAAGPSQGAKRGDAGGERLFSPSEPAQAGSEPLASAPSGATLHSAIIANCSEIQPPQRISSRTPLKSSSQDSILVDAWARP